MSSRQSPAYRTFASSRGFLPVRLDAEEEEGASPGGGARSDIDLGDGTARLPDVDGSTSRLRSLIGGPPLADRTRTEVLSYLCDYRRAETT